MKQNIKVFYWSPSLVSIATNYAVINSAYSLNKYSNNYETRLINFFGEFERFREDLDKKKIKVIDYFKHSIFNYFPRHGKIKSRLSFLIIFLMSFFPLKNLIKKEEPRYLIIHLITSLPLILLIFFNFKTKFILRISGFPKMNFIRKYIWKLALKKIHLVTCPTINTMNYIKKMNIVKPEKLKVLYDPILNIKEISKKKNEKLDLENYYLSIGRLTKQKNFIFLCKAFKNLVKKENNLKLLIAGEGEENKYIKEFIDKNNLNKNIQLLGHVKNVFPYLMNAKCFILSSLWEDPGFVLIESAICRTLVLTNDSWPGPKELIKDKINGFVYEKNNFDSFYEKFNLMKESKDIQSLKKKNLISAKKFTIFNHYKSLNGLLLIDE